MTKSQCSNEIVRNQTLIAQYESEIRGYQQQIREYSDQKEGDQFSWQVVVKFLHDD